MAEDKGSQKLAIDWLKALSQHDDQTRQLREAKNTLASARDRFAISMLPNDARNGEVISVWVRTSEIKGGERLFTVSVIDRLNSKYEVQVRR